MATATELQGQIVGFANTRFVRVSPQRARLVIDLIRGQRAEDALETLRFTKKRVAKEIEKTLRSAIANAERKADDAGASLDGDALFVTGCCGCGRSGSVKGREGRRAEGSQGNREAREGSAEEVGGSFGAENTSVRVSAGLQQGLEIALVRQERLRGPVA